MTEKKPVFLGFLPKKVLKRPAWLKAEAVEEVCSVSECMSPASADRINRWVHNEAGFYNTEELALSTVPEKERLAFRLFAFREWPLKFAGGEVDESANPNARWTDLPRRADLSGYLPVGYDLVGRSRSSFFECSPLSCNGMAEHIPVNRHCLVDELERALEVGREFSRESSGVEPADYYLVEVLEKK
jgi:hypothetical protein